MAKVSENRQSKRYAPQHDLRVDFYYDIKTEVNFEQTAVEKAVKYKGISKNISTHGICFISAVALQRGEYLNLEIFIPLQDMPIHMRGRVCWSEKDQDCSDKFNTGIEIQSVEGKNVEETIYHDETYDVNWSDVLETVLGQFRILAQQEKKGMGL